MAEFVKAGVKRPYASTDLSPLKKRKIQHHLRHIQHRPQDIEPAAQDPTFAQSQLLRSLVSALALAGFDSVKPTALEMLRAAAEEYMMHLLHYIRTSMQNGRRTKPTAQDFASALALMPNTSSASLLNPQLSLRIPPDISCPPIPAPDPAIPPAPDFSALLQPLMPKDWPTYVPKHFPALPSRHAWRSTPVFPEREIDARKMREKAMEEGLLAEQALRKLAAAAKAGVVKAEKRRDAALAGPGRARGRERERGKTSPGKVEEMFDEMLRQARQDDDDAGLDGDGDLAMDGGDAEERHAVIVNYDMAGWRHSGRKRLRL